MPSVTHEGQQPLPSPISPAKKRRRDDGAGDLLHPQLYAASLQPSRSSSNSLLPGRHGYSSRHEASHSQPLRRIIPLASAKRIRIYSEDEDTAGIPRRSQSPNTSTAQNRTSTPVISAALDDDQDQGTPKDDRLQETDANSRPVPPSRQNTQQALSLARCHICHRKPTKKADVDSFADCEGCGQRACFVCMRHCLDWRPSRADKTWSSPAPQQQPQQDMSSSFHMEDADAGHDHPTETAVDDVEEQRASEPPGWIQDGGHRQMICSRCCVERGPEGDVVCLGCLRFVDG